MFVARSLVRSGIMSASSAVVQRLEQRAQLADEIISRLQQQVEHLRRTVVGREEQRVAKENILLRQEVTQLKARLIEAETRNGVNQVPVPNTGSTLAASATKPPPASTATAPSQAPPQAQTSKKQESTSENQKKKEKKEKPKKEPKKADDQAAADVDFSNLDLRIGKIINVKKHPDADSLYVEEVELGEPQTRTVVSGLVKHIPIEEMQDRTVILCCNLKPAKMRGILSQAMVMCASSPDKVEILAPPSDAVPGDRVGCEGYEMSGSFPVQMNPKKKIFERIQPDLKTNDKLQATYKGSLWKVEGKGYIISSTMANSGIK
nr:aminoacyl tRNA synthase complex-interacting multifunctional protein 1-like [Lytechinus pictus]